MAKPLSLVKSSRSTLSKLWYLFHLSSKYDFNLTSLHKNLIEAHKCQPQTCGPLIIECRGESDDFLVFLLTDESKNLVRQFRIPRILLEGNMLFQIMEYHGISIHENDNHHKFLERFLKTK